MTQPDNPRTLRPSETAPLVDDVGLDSLSPKDYVRSQEDLLYGHLADKTREGLVLRVNKTSGRVEQFVGGDAGAEDKYGFGGTSSTEKWSGSTDAALEAQTYYDNLLDSQRELDYAKEDAAAAKAAGGAVESYMSSESKKSKEIERQYEDFQDRASLLYDLMGDEQDYGMAADDQNIQNMKAQKDLGMAIMPGGYYTKPYMQDSLSSILAPSLPDYVRPDYRQNASVGLPGPQGFDDPDYSSSGLPMYAAGTDPQKPREIFWPWRNQ